MKWGGILCSPFLGGLAVSEGPLEHLGNPRRSAPLPGPAPGGASPWLQDPFFLQAGTHCPPFSCPFLPVPSPLPTGTHTHIQAPCPPSALSPQPRDRGDPPLCLPWPWGPRACGAAQ